MTDSKNLERDHDEQSILAQCFLDNDIVPYIVYGIKDWYFTNPIYQAIFRAVQKIEQEDENGKPKAVDIGTVYNTLTTTPNILKGLTVTVADIAGVTYGVPVMSEGDRFLTQSIERVRESARLRYIEKLSVEMQRRVASGESKSADIAGWFEEAFEKLTIETDYDNSEGFVMLGSYADRMKKMYEDFHSGKITALEMPFPQLTAILGFGGLMPTDLIILAAHTSFGKTTLALKIAKYVLDTQGDAAMFSLEMSEESLFMKMHSTVAQMNSNKIRPYMSNLELKVLLDTLDQMRGLRLFTDSRTTDLYELRAKAKRLKKRNKNLKLIIVDYLQLIGTHNTRHGEKERIAEVSRQLKLLAMELQIPVIALSQFSRDSYKNDEEPRLSDLYGSGSIEKDADHVWFIHGEKPDHTITIRKVELIVAKQRKNGGLGRVPLIFNAPLGDFAENTEVIYDNGGTPLAYKEVETVDDESDDYTQVEVTSAFPEESAPNDDDIPF